MGSSSTTLAALAAATREAGRQQSVSDILQVIAEAARESVPGFDHAGISLIDPRNAIETVAATDELVWELDRVQYDLGEGPCVSAMREQPVVVVVPHARHAQSWPAYMPVAVGLGLRAQLAVRLFIDETGSMGALNLYSTNRDDIDPDAQGVADLFAAQAAVALVRTRKLEHLHQALESRDIIGQALGIVMERYTLDDDLAFAFLLRASSHGNMKLRTIAEELVAEANQQNTRHP